MHYKKRKVKWKKTMMKLTVYSRACDGHQSLSPTHSKLGLTFQGRAENLTRAETPTAIASRGVDNSRVSLAETFFFPSLFFVAEHREKFGNRYSPNSTETR